VGERARLEQVEANLVATDTRIEPQHVVGECRQLAQQLDTAHGRHAIESAAEYDDAHARSTCLAQ
jgi:hypothetical protein